MKVRLTKREGNGEDTQASRGKVMIDGAKAMIKLFFKERKYVL